MTAQIRYDFPLAERWDQAQQHINSGENGIVTVPLTNTVETSGRYYLIAENSAKQDSTIYAALYIDDPNLNSIPFGYERKIDGKRYIMIPAASYQKADAYFQVWEDSQQNGIGITSATHYILRRLTK